MWASSFLKSAVRMSFTPLMTSSRSYASVSKPQINDCTFMQLRSQILMPNLFIHNIREMLEKLSLGDEMTGLAELMELSLINQSNILPSIILPKNDYQ